MSQDALGQLNHLKTARARWPFPDEGAQMPSSPPAVSLFASFPLLLPFPSPSYSRFCPPHSVSLRDMAFDGGRFCRVMWHGPVVVGDCQTLQLLLISILIISKHYKAHLVGWTKFKIRTVGTVCTNTLSVLLFLQ